MAIKRLVVAATPGSIETLILNELEDNFDAKVDREGREAFEGYNRATKLDYLLSYSSNEELIAGFKRRYEDRVDALQTFLKFPKTTQVQRLIKVYRG